jgi:hypothetical protein
MKACTDSDLKPLRLIYDIPTRWNSAYTMLERAIYLRTAINRFLSVESELEELSLSISEWDQCASLLKILYPFKLESTQIQRSTVPTIDRVYWSYERMFNALDDMNKKLGLRRSISKKRPKDVSWIDQLTEACQAMRQKLVQYYTDANHFVFSEAIILDPTIKTRLFETRTYQQYGLDYKTIYTDQMRRRFESTYADLDIGDAPSIASSGMKRKREDDFVDDFKRTLLEDMNTKPENEFDRYLQAPNSTDIRSTLDYWRLNCFDFPRMAMMVRDVYAVPASSAGVEREFSKGGKIAIPTRARLNPDTIEEAMMYKAYLDRKGKPIDEADDVYEDSDEDLEEGTWKFLKVYTVDGGYVQMET